MIAPVGGRDIGAIARSLTRWSKDRSVDRCVIDLAAEVTRLHRALRDLSSKDDRDTDEIPGFSDMADDLASLAQRLCECEASGLAGFLAKADLAVGLHSHPGERAARIALSMARDFHAIAETYGIMAQPLPAP